MKKTMLLTEEEIKLISDKREKEDINCSKKIGYLVENLYVPHVINYDENFFYTKDQADNIKENLFMLAAKAGSVFDCYIEKDGSESWYDRVYGIERMSKEWAEANLRNIKNIKPKRKPKVKL